MCHKYQDVLCFVFKKACCWSVLWLWKRPAKDKRPALAFPAENLGSRLWLCLTRSGFWQAGLIYVLTSFKPGTPTPAKKGDSLLGSVWDLSSPLHKSHCMGTVVSERHQPNPAGWKHVWVHSRVTLGDGTSANICRAWSFKESEGEKGKQTFFLPFCLCFKRRCKENRIFSSSHAACLSMVHPAI